MPMHSPARIRRSFRVALLCAGLVAGDPGHAQDNNNQINQAQEQLQTERYDEALASAKEAVRIKPDDYRGHYYVAMAFMVLKQFDAADAAIARAQTLSPENAREAVAKLKTAIASARQGMDKVGAADAAFADGLLAKAARLYREAWNAQHDKPELALKAADLYANRLGDPVTAATLLREVIALHQGTQPAEKAQVQFDRIAVTVKQIGAQKLQEARAKQGNWDEETRLIAEAQAADPSNKDIYLWRAYRGSMSIFEDYYKDAIKDLARLGLATDENLLQTSIHVWIDKPGFSDFLADVLGTANVDRLKATIVQRRAAAKAEAERQKVEAERKEAARLAAVERERMESEARRKAEASKLEYMEYQLAANSAEIRRKAGEIMALRKAHWENFIQLLRSSAIEGEFKVWFSGRGIKNRFVHYYNNITQAPGSVTINGGARGEDASRVRVTPGSFLISDLYDSSFGAEQMPVYLDRDAPIKAIGEPDVTKLPSEQSESSVWFNGRKFKLDVVKTRIAALIAQQKQMAALRGEISSLYEPIPKLQQALKAAGRNVSVGPIYYGRDQN